MFGFWSSLLCFWLCPLVLQCATEEPTTFDEGTTQPLPDDFEVTMTPIEDLLEDTEEDIVTPNPVDLDRSTVPNSTVTIAQESSEDLIVDREVKNTSLLIRGKGDAVLVSPGVCDFCLYEGQGNFTSYDYPLPYRPNLNCTYRVKRVHEDACQLEVVFHDFDLQGRGNEPCTKDYLQINGRRFCGRSWRGKRVIVNFSPEMEEATFYFRTDRSVSGRGMWIEIFQHPGTCSSANTAAPLLACEERFTQKQFFLRSPGFPRNYGNLEDCLYIVKRASSDVCGLEMTFLRFDVEQIDMCSYDALEIDGQKLCGTLPKDSVRVFMFREDQKIIKFQSDSQGVRSGFHIKVRQITDCYPDSVLPPPPSCNVCTSAATDELSSYGYPDHYRNNLLCAYTIERTGKEYCSVELEFIDFDLKITPECRGDYLQLGGKRYCGKSLKGHTKQFAYDPDGSLVMVFHTDNATVGKGFFLQFRQIKCPHPPIILPQREEGPPLFCDKLFLEKEFYIQTINYSSNYPHHLDCRYIIRKFSPEVCELEVTFVSFDVEYGLHCQYDYLEIDGQRFCGTLAQDLVRVFDFSTSEKNLRFRSDSAVSRPGFLLHVRQRTCKSRSTLLPAMTTPTFCDKVFSSTDFEITSVGYPSNNYEPNLDCNYIIRRHSNATCQLQLTFMKFDVQADKKCRHDFFDIGDERICGHLPIGEMRHLEFENRRQIDLLFHSDSVTEDRGFVIRARQVPCDATTLPPDAVLMSTVPMHPAALSEADTCDETFSEREFEIKSKNYPKDYDNHSHCVYTIKRYSKSVCYLELQFWEFDLESTNECEYDYLQFGDTKMCGSLKKNEIKRIEFTEPEMKIFFHSDAATTRRGFHFVGKQKECDTSATEDVQVIESCDRIFSGIEFEFKSENYPNNYANNLDCRYTVRRYSKKVCRLEVTLQKFDVEDGAECQYDYFQLDKKKLCGSLPSKTKYTLDFRSSELTMRFHSDSKLTRPGFLLNVRQIECADSSPESSGLVAAMPSVCEYCFTDVSGTFKSYDYPENYPPHLQCTYKFMGKPGYCSVLMSFADFQLESSLGECDADYVEINGIKYCGRQLNEKSKSLTFYGAPREVSMRFITDGQDQYKGFRGTYWQMPCPNATSENTTKSLISSPSRISPKSGYHALSPPRASCDRIFTSLEFDVTSPGYPKNYPNNADCRYVIRKISPRICSLRFNFVSFDVESSSGCDYDYLEVDGQKLCGTMSPNAEREYYFRGHQFNLQFRSDAASSRPGFSIRIRQVDCSPPPTMGRKSIPPPPIFPIRPPQRPVSPPTSFYPLPPIGDSKGRHTPLPIPRFPPPPFYPPYGGGGGGGGQSHDSGGPSYPVPRPKYIPQRPTMFPMYPPLAPACDRVINDVFFELSSAGYPNPYQPNLSCRYTIQRASDAICQLDLYFVDFDTPYSYGCYADFLSIDGEKICGRIPKNEIRRFDFKTPEKLMYFRSDDTGGGRGFMIRGRQVDCSGAGMGSGKSAGGGPTGGGGIYYPPAKYPISPPTSRPGRPLYPPKPMFPPTFIPPAPAPYFPGSKGGGVVPCVDQTISSMDFTVTSPGFPAKYPYSISCRYIIRRNSPDICGLEFTFMSFDVENDPQSRCLYDYLEIDGEKMCGEIQSNTKRKFYFNPAESEKVMIFRSDREDSRSGFSIHVSQISECETTDSPTNSDNDNEPSANTALCDIVLKDSRGHFSSPNFPRSYSNNLRCSYRILPVEGYCSVDMYFRDFDLESSQSCEKDYLLIEGTRYCGQDLMHKTRELHFPTGLISDVQILFNTDNDKALPGFFIEYRQIPCRGSRWVELSTEEMNREREPSDVMSSAIQQGISRTFQRSIHVLPRNSNPQSNAASYIFQTSYNSDRFGDNNHFDSKGLSSSPYTSPIHAPAMEQTVKTRIEVLPHPRRTRRDTAQTSEALKGKSEKYYAPGIRGPYSSFTPQTRYPSSPYPRPPYPDYPAAPTYPNRNQPAPGYPIGTITEITREYGPDRVPRQRKIPDETIETKPIEVLPRRGRRDTSKERDTSEKSEKYFSIGHETPHFPSTSWHPHRPFSEYESKRYETDPRGYDHNCDHNYGHSPGYPPGGYPSHGKGGHGVYLKSAPIKVLPHRQRREYRLFGVPTPRIGRLELMTYETQSESNPAPTSHAVSSAVEHGTSHNFERSVHVSSSSFIPETDFSSTSASSSLDSQSPLTDYVATHIDSETSSEYAKGAFRDTPSIHAPGSLSDRAVDLERDVMKSTLIEAGSLPLRRFRRNSKEPLETSESQADKYYDSRGGIGGQRPTGPFGQRGGFGPTPEFQRRRPPFRDYSGYSGYYPNTDWFKCNCNNNGTGPQSPHPPPGGYQPHGNNGSGNSGGGGGGGYPPTQGGYPPGNNPPGYPQWNNNNNNTGTTPTNGTIGGETATRGQSPPVEVIPHHRRGRRDSPLPQNPSARSEKYYAHWLKQGPPLAFTPQIPYFPPATFQHPVQPPLASDYAATRFGLPPQPYYGYPSGRPNNVPGLAPFEPSISLPGRRTQGPEQTVKTTMIEVLPRRNNPTERSRRL